jgi:competence protein ComEC
MIVDCGSTGATTTDLDAKLTRDYIRNVLSSHTTAPNVVLSHADLDHYGHISSVLDDITVASVWQGGDVDHYADNGFPAWLARQEKGGVMLKRNFPPHFHNGGNPIGADLSCGDASTFVLTVNTGSSRNAHSLVLMIEYQDFTAVFTGDAEGSTEARAITNFGTNVKATVMTSSHHGASTHASNSQDWATMTAPDVLISSAGDKFFHPRCDSVNRFTTLATTREHSVRCGSSTAYTSSRTTRAHYVTEVNGTVIVTSNGRSPLSVHCSRSSECGVTIAH